MSAETIPQPQGTLHFTLATAGHVDHGKTSVLRALTGTDPDRLKEEKEREMTIDLGFAHMRATCSDIERVDANSAKRFEEALGADFKRDSSELVVGFVDVPGHGKFLKNMLAGVGGMDMALLVVAADESIMPQTIQHVKILTLLGVRDCILVMNKIDLADADQQALATEETLEFLDRFGINVVEVVPFSATSDATTRALKDAIVKHILAQPIRDRRQDSVGKMLPSFLSIDRVFSKAGYGAVVTGTLTKGSIKVGDEVQIEPGAIAGRVRGLQTFSHKLEKAFPGQRLAINLALKENKSIERGQAVVGDKVSVVETMVVQLTDLGGLESSKEISDAGLKPQNIRFYHGTAERYASLRWLESLDVAELDVSAQPDAAKRANLRQPMIGQIFLTEPLVAAPGEKFIVRYGDFGIAGGEILMTARPRWLSRAMLKPLAEKVWNHDLEGAALELLNLSPQRSLGIEVMNSLLPDFDRRQIIRQLIEKGEIEKLGDQLISKAEKLELEERIIASLTKAAEAGSREPAISQEKLKVDIAPLVDRMVFQAIIKGMLAADLIVKLEEKLALPSVAAASDSLDASLSAVSEKILEILEGNFCLEISEIAVQSGYKASDVTDALNKLKKDGKASVINYEYASNADSILAAHQALVALFQKKRNIAPGDFREAIGTSRKYAMALLAYFDDENITRRLPTGRVLIKMPAAKKE